jgi:hypothetical protein
MDSHTPLLQTPGQADRWRLLAHRVDSVAGRRAMFAVMAFIFVFVGASTVYRASPWASKHRTDFTVYTAAGQAVVQGTPLYEAQNSRGWLYMYLPIFAIAMVPLSFFPDAVAAGIWYVISVAMLVHMLWLSGSLARRFWPDTNWPVAWIGVWTFFGIFWPTVSGMARGQASVLLAWLVTLAIWAWFEKRQWLAGAALAAAIVVKVFPVLFLAYFAFKRQWTMLLATGVWLAMMVFVLPSLVFGVGGNLDLLRTWVNDVVMDANRPDVSEEGERYGQMANPRLERNQSVQAVMIRLIAPNDDVADATGMENVAEWVGRGICGILGIVTAIACWRGRASRSDRTTLVQFALLIMLMLFVSPVSWSHSFALMALPMAILLAAAGTTAAPGWHRYAAVYFVFFALAVVASFVLPLRVIGTLLWSTVAVFIVLWPLARVTGPSDEAALPDTRPA